MNVETWHRDMYETKSEAKVAATPRQPLSSCPDASTSVVDLSCLLPVSLDPTIAATVMKSQVEAVLERVLAIQGMQVVSSEELAVDFSRSVGEGSFGVAYRGTWLQQDVAVKVVRDEILADPRCHPLIVDHISTLLGIQHPNVQLFIGVSISESTGRLYLGTRTSLSRISISLSSPFPSVSRSLSRSLTLSLSLHTLTVCTIVFADGVQCLSTWGGRLWMCSCSSVRCSPWPTACPWLARWALRRTGCTSTRLPSSTATFAPRTSSWARTIASPSPTWASRH